MKKKILLAAIAVIFIFSVFPIIGGTQTKAADSWNVSANSDNGGQSEFGWWHYKCGTVNSAYNIQSTNTSTALEEKQTLSGPTIAICSRYGSDYQEDSDLIDALKSIGCKVKRISSAADISGYDGLVIPGGIDIDPQNYGESDYACYAYSAEYDEEQFAIIKKFVDAKKPILGVCRGCQVLNVYFGGSLYQDISGHRSDEGTFIWHTVYSKEGSAICSACAAHFKVASSHHQGLKVIADGFEVTAWAFDGTAECIEHTSLPIIGVLWHPEWMDNANGKAILNYFAYTMCNVSAGITD